MQTPAGPDEGLSYPSQILPNNLVRLRDLCPARDGGYHARNTPTSGAP